MTKREKDADITVIIRKDGDAWFAHGPDFIDLVSSDAEFGSTPEEAATKYLRLIETEFCHTCKRYHQGDTETFVCVGGLLEHEQVVVGYDRPACDKWELTDMHGRKLR